MNQSKARGHWEGCGVGPEMWKGSKKKRSCLKARVRMKTERSREHGKEGVVGVWYVE